MQKNAQKNKSFFTIVIWIYFTMHVFCILIPTFLFWPWNSDHAILNNFWNYFMGYMRVSILLGTRNIRNKVYFVIFHVRLLHFHQHLFNNLILYFKSTKKMHNNEIVNTWMVDVIDLLVIPICAFAAQSTIVLSWIDFPPLVQSSDARHLPSFIIIDSCVTLIYDPNHLNFLMIYTYFKIILNKNYGHFPAKFYNRIFGTFIYFIKNKRDSWVSINSLT